MTVLILALIAVPFIFAFACVIGSCCCPQKKSSCNDNHDDHCRDINLAELCNCCCKKPLRSLPEEEENLHTIIDLNSMSSSNSLTDSPKNHVINSKEKIVSSYSGKQLVESTLAQKNSPLNLNEDSISNATYKKKLETLTMQHLELQQQVDFLQYQVKEYSKKNDRLIEMLNKEDSLLKKQIKISDQMRTMWFNSIQKNANHTSNVTPSSTAHSQSNIYSFWSNKMVNSIKPPHQSDKKELVNILLDLKKNKKLQIESEYQKILKNKDENGQTTLHYAVIHNDIEAVEILLSEGADPDERNQENQTAYDLAKDESMNQLLLTKKNFQRPSLSLSR